MKKHEIKTKIQEEINCGIPESKLISLEFTRDETSQNLVWLSKREFKYFEMIFQIVKVQYKGDKIVYLCRINPESAALLQELDNLVDSTSGQDQENQKASDNLTYYFNNLFFLASDEIDRSFLFADILSGYEIIDRLLIRYTEIADPPPKFSIC